MMPPNKPAPTTAQRQSLLLPLTVCAVTAVAVFVLPLYVPVTYRATISASYVAGFNNTVAIAMTVAMSLAVLVSTLVRHQGVQAPPDETHRYIGTKFTAVTVALSSLVLAAAGWIVIHSRAPYTADAGYIIQVATAKRESGLSLYTELEFAYGPLLLMPEVWLSNFLHVSMQCSYYTMLIVDQGIGLLMLAFVLNSLPMTRAWRRFGFALIAFGCISPLLGINYSLLRFGTGLAAIVACSRIHNLWKCAVAAAAAEAIVLLISPEMGMALMIGLGCLFLARYSGGWLWVAGALVPLVILILSFASVGKPYLRMIAQFSRGTLTLPVGPYPHLLIFLFATVWLVPSGLAALIRTDVTDRGTVLACYALGLATLPAALGRCDPLHVFFNGLPFLLLSFVIACRFRPKAQVVWGTCFAIFVGWQFYVNAHLLQERTSDVVRLVFSHPDLTAFSNEPGDTPSVTEEALYQLDAPTLNAIVGSASVATPAQVSPQIMATLIASHHYNPGFYSFGVDAMNPSAEAHRIQDLNRNEWALLPRVLDPPLLETTDDLAGVQGFLLPYPHRHPNPTQLGDAFQQNIDDNWKTVRTFGPYVLMRKQADSSTP